MTDKFSKPFWILLLMLTLSKMGNALPSSTHVERITDLGFGFRRVTVAEPVASNFEGIGHFEYLYCLDRKLCRLGDCSVSPSGSYLIFQDGPSGILFLYRRLDGRRVQLTKKFVALVQRFEWHEDSGTVEVRFETGVPGSYSIPISVDARL